MKKCPYCAEEIQDEAVICRYCGREINEVPITKEKAFNQNKQVFISNRRAMIGRTAYSMPNITSVSIVKESPSWTLGILVAIVGLIFGCAAMFLLQQLPIIEIITFLVFVGGGAVIGILVVSYYG